MNTGEQQLCNRVREIRKRRGLRQSDLAEAAGTTRQTVIGLEKGRINPSITLALKVARALQEPVDYVFYLERAEAADEAQLETPRAVTPAPAKKPKAEKDGKLPPVDSDKDDSQAILEFF